ncbi:MAG: bifunctional riboflavin kinase/FAD synthetase [bacterium]
MKVTQYIQDIDNVKNSVVTVGSFDGVHLGHQILLKEVVERALDMKGRSVVVTFEPHPKEVLRGNNIQLLTTLEERVALCGEAGIDILYVIPFTYEFSRNKSRDFYLKFLVEGIGVSEVVEGYDHHFGRDREGGVESLLQLGKEFEFSVTAIKPVHVDGELVSSSGIRQHLLDGEVDRASALLGRHYGLSGFVIRGDGRGKTLGYPTANVQPLSPKKLTPGNGIYFVKVKIQGKKYYGMLSIGVRPTFYKHGQRVIEVYVSDFEGDLYNQQLELFFILKLRDEVKFDSSEALIAQMNLDKQRSAELQKVYPL